MATTSYTHNIISALLRCFEFACALIVVVILGRFFYYLGDSHVHANGRLVYTMVVGGISLLYSFCFCPPFNILFMAFPVDFVLSVMWLIAFCLIITLSGTNTCTSSWFYNYWGHYWDYYERVWRGYSYVRISGSACPLWRTILAFSFMAILAHLLSGLLGIYVYREHIKPEREGRTGRTPTRTEKIFRRHSSSTAQQPEVARPEYV
jgi:hypothetical protein